MSDITPEIGSNIRRRRRLLGLTLEALAGSSGVSATMLSEVERSVKNPTVKLAYQIARALGCSLTDLLEEPPSTVSVVRAEERGRLVDPETGVKRYGVATDLRRRGLEVVTYVIPPKASAGEMLPNRAGVVEFVNVIRGTLELKLGEENWSLSRGDSMTYGPQSLVEYRNPGGTDCEFLLLSDASQAR